jgi:hypothetical protein
MSINPRTALDPEFARRLGILHRRDTRQAVKRLVDALLISALLIMIGAVIAIDLLAGGR